MVSLSHVCSENSITLDKAYLKQAQNHSLYFCKNKREHISEIYIDELTNEISFLFPLAPSFLVCSRISPLVSLEF